MICFAAFALLGIGNTILQVSLNPLLSNIVQGKMLTGTLTGGQFIKSVSAFLGPIIAGFCSLRLGSWEMIFPFYAFIALVSALWLYFTRIDKEKVEHAPSLGITFNLLKNKKILFLFLGILAIVGLDVGMNILVPKLLMERIGLAKEAAGYGTSWYFAARTAGTFIGAFLLVRVTEIKYFRINIILTLSALIGLFFVHSYFLIILMVVIIAFTCSTVFSILFSVALQTKPRNANEISGLMVTGVSGGAIVPPLMGICTEHIGNQNGSILIILICTLYLVFWAFALNNTPKTRNA
jgi:Fucose permease